MDYNNISGFIGNGPLFGFQIQHNEERVIGYTQGVSLLNKFHFYRKFYGSCKNNFEIRWRIEYYIRCTLKQQK